jgi:hypothetical protein
MPATNTNNAYRFEQLIARLLVANRFVIQTDRADVQGGRFDFIAKLDNESWAIEIKYYRTERAQVALLESAAARLVGEILRVQIRKGMLIVACSLDVELRRALEEKYGLIFVDRADLFNWASNAPEIIDELSALLEVGSQSRDIPRGRSVEESLTGKSPPKSSLPVDTHGTELCRELHALKRGKNTWTSYEKLSVRILKYLFPQDLHGSHSQKRTDEGLNRFDFICRIKPTTDFWSFLIEHLGSRYILFEFKNYRGQVKQGQILTTEKYLLEKGLRRAAIVLSRAGASKDARTMTQGAMRENGKLMLILDDEQVCRMLHMKELGEDPTDLLFDVVDEFLLSLPR